MSISEESKLEMEVLVIESNVGSRRERRLGWSLDQPPTLALLSLSTTHEVKFERKQIEARSEG